MSVAILTQVHDETRRLAIAGSNLASGDFRLKKLAPPLEKSAAKAPVFGKVAEGIEKLTESTTKDSAEALLELSTLVSAILYTQGETGARGKLQSIESSEFRLPTSEAGARMVKPLVEALTTTGSGREEIIRDAHRRGAFKDLRMVRPAVAAIDDVYAPIADFVAAEVLPTYGMAIYDDLRASYNPKAKGGQVRRLRLMHRLDPAKTHELVEQALEAGSVEMKVAAIGCLEGKKDALSYLLEQSRAKSKEVRRAALQAMSTLPDDEVVEALTKSLSGADLALAAGPASQNRSPKLLKFLLEQADKQLDELFSIKAKAKLNKAVSNFDDLLNCFASRDDKKTIELLTRCFERRDEIAAIKGDTGGGQINQHVASLLVRTNHKPALKRVVDAHETLPPEVLDCALLAAVRTRKPKEVYDLFSPYFLVKVEGKKKRGDAASLKRESVRELLGALCGQRIYGRYYYRSFAVDFDELEIGPIDSAVGAELDSRWLEAAIKMADTEMVLLLARPKHKGACQFLSKTLDALLKKRGDLDFEASGVLETMLRIEHPKAVEHYLEALKKIAGTKRYYYAYWLARLIPSLPKSAAPKVEALLPSMSDKLVDEIAPYLAELQAKA